MTHREFLTWQAWIDRQWNRPDRTDFYLMQVACEVRRVLSRKPAGIKIDDFRLPFGEEGQRELKRQDAEEIAKQAKQGWAAYLSAKLGKAIDWTTGKVKEE